jgi:hypothetical protein
MGLAPSGVSEGGQVSGSGRLAKIGSTQSDDLRKIELHFSLGQLYIAGLSKQSH